VEVKMTFERQRKERSYFELVSSESKQSLCFLHSEICEEDLKKECDWNSVQFKN
jgi:hypothetical protein